MAEERIQKIMAEQGLCSRRAAEQIIAEGRVKVNGHPVKVGDKMDPNRDVLHVDDERIYIQKNQQLYYLALYKPRGYVTTASDELGRKTVMDLVSDIPARLYPVGRSGQGQRGPAADDQRRCLCAGRYPSVRRHLQAVPRYRAAPRR